MAALEALDSMTAAAVYSALEAGAEEPHRPHLGASLIGEPCERRLWYTFRWCDHEVFSGRMLRLFETGKKAEARFVTDLRGAGVEVVEDDGNGNQIRVTDHGGHFGGSLDGVGRGVPEAPKTWHVLEFKTHSDKSFKSLKKLGVKEHKPLHWHQMNTYMGYTELTRALYVAENKNDSELFSDRFEFDAVVFAKDKAKALRIIQAQEPLPRISNDPTARACSYCPFKDICHGKKLPEVNCRTCMHSTPVVEAESNARWRCEHHNADVPVDAQRQQHHCHRYIPVFLERSARAVDVQAGVVIYDCDGRSFGNGDGSDGTITSAELRQAGAIECMPEAAEAKRQIATARVVG